MMIDRDEIENDIKGDKPLLKHHDENIAKKNLERIGN